MTQTRIDYNDIVCALRGWGHDDLADNFVRVIVAHEGTDAVRSVEVGRALTADEIARLVNHPAIERDLATIYNIRDRQPPLPGGATGPPTRDSVPASGGLPLDAPCAECGATEHFPVPEDEGHCGCGGFCGCPCHGGRA